MYLEHLITSNWSIMRHVIYAYGTKTGNWIPWTSFHVSPWNWLQTFLRTVFLILSFMNVVNIPFLCSIKLQLEQLIVCLRISLAQCELHSHYTGSVCTARTGLKAVSPRTAWFCDLPGWCQAAVNPQREACPTVLWKAATTTSLVWSDFSMGRPGPSNTSYGQTFLPRFPLWVSVCKHTQVLRHRRFWIGGGML